VPSADASATRRWIFCQILSGCKAAEYVLIHPSQRKHFPIISLRHALLLLNDFQEYIRDRSGPDAKNFQGAAQAQTDALLQ